MKRIIVILLWVVSCSVAFSQNNFFLRNGIVFKDTSFKLEIGNKVKAISVAAPLVDSVFVPFKCKVIFVSSLNNIYSITLRTNDQYYVFLTNLKSINVKNTQDLEAGIFIGYAFYDDIYKKYILDVSIKKENVDLSHDEIVRYLRVL